MVLRNYSHRGFEWRQAFIEGLVELDPVSLEAAQIGGLLVRLALLPATPQYPQPLEGHHANGRPVALALAPLLLIEQAGPLALADGTLGKLHDTLMVEDGPRIAELYQLLAAALFFDRRHTAKTEQVIGRLEVGANSPEGRRQPRSQDRAATGQGSKEPRLAVLAKDGFDPPVIFLKAL